MITLEQLRTEYKPRIMELAKKYGMSNIRVFGSVARGDADENSDVDFLVAIEKGADAWGIGGFYVEATKLLGHEVDMTTEGGLSKYIKEIVLREACVL